MNKLVILSALLSIIGLTSLGQAQWLPGSLTSKAAGVAVGLSDGTINIRAKQCPAGQTLSAVQFRAMDALTIFNTAYEITQSTSVLRFAGADCPLSTAIQDCPRMNSFLDIKFANDNSPIGAVRLESPAVDYISNYTLSNSPLHIGATISYLNKGYSFGYLPDFDITNQTQLAQIVASNTVALKFRRSLLGLNFNFQAFSGGLGTFYGSVISSINLSANFVCS